MTHRTAIVAIPDGLVAVEAAHVCMQSGYSRYPVYRGSLDEVIGVTHAFDLLRIAADAPVPARPTLVVPGTTRAADLMLEMQRGQGHLAVVLDEFGGTAGLLAVGGPTPGLGAATLRSGGTPAPAPRAAPK